MKTTEKSDAPKKPFSRRGIERFIALLSSPATLLKRLAVLTVLIIVVPVPVWLGSLRMTRLDMVLISVAYGLMAYAAAVAVAALASLLVKIFSKESSRRDRIVHGLGLLLPPLMAAIWFLVLVTLEFHHAFIEGGRAW